MFQADSAEVLDSLTSIESPVKKFSSTTLKSTEKTQNLICSGRDAALEGIRPDVGDFESSAIAALRDYQVKILQQIYKYRQGEQMRKLIGGAEGGSNPGLRIAN